MADILNQTITLCSNGNAKYDTAKKMIDFPKAVFALFAMVFAVQVSCQVALSAEEPVFSPKVFAQQVDAAHKESPLREEAYATLKEQAVEQLARWVYIPDKAVLRLTDLARKLDYRDAREKEEKAGKPDDIELMDFAREFAIIDQLIPLLDERPWLVSRLLADKAYGLGVMGRAEEAYAVREKLFAISENIKLETDLATLKDQIELADCAAETKRIERADQLYAFATTYPFGDAEPAARFRAARELVLRAARGLVRVRRNNAQKLSYIFLAPGIKADIKPELDNAFKEVGLPVEE